jgi:hypothetical protein
MTATQIDINKIAAWGPPSQIEVGTKAEEGTSLGDGCEVRCRHYGAIPFRF